MNSRTRIYEKFDAGIVGGGLAGLSLAILLAKRGYKIIVFEKDQYPLNKVCGEYISLESRRFIEEEVGLHLTQFNVPVIKKLIVTAPGGAMLNANLDLGGFGISRYLMDNELRKIAVDNGATVLEQTKVNDIIFEENGFIMQTNRERFTCTVAVGSFGKRSNIDVKWDRSFVKQKQHKLNNYIGVKYHIKTSFPGDTIALHNFKDGYCGISKVEDNTCCLCYLTTAKNLRANNNSIKLMEENILCRNKFLKKIFHESTFIFKEPLTISQISFEKKSLVQNHVLMTGDAAGMITPLCGNGMSMAFHSSKIAAELIQQFLEKKLTRMEMEHAYQLQWKKQFNTRLKTGRWIQRLFGKETTTNLFIKTIRHFPGLANRIIKATHGKPF